MQRKSKQPGWDKEVYSLLVNAKQLILQHIYNIILTNQNIDKSKY